MLIAMNRMVLIQLCVPLLQASAAIALSPDGYHVYPGDNIQEAIQQAARNPTNKVVKMHAGEYRPTVKRQAMIWLNKAHDGVRVEAVGEVTLTATNPELAKPSDPGYPAVVNHVIYIGDGVTSNTVVRGFRITGANNFVSKELTRQIEPNATILRNYFFFSDGGAIKIFGRSYPTIQDMEITDNYSNPCGGGISIQHQGYTNSSVLIENCRFLRNRAQATGPAIDLLEGSAARIINCLFVGNVSNVGEDPVGKSSGQPGMTNNGAITIFWKSFAEIRNCTFTGNRNGVDDMGGASTYANCIFYDNNLDEGLKGFPRYDLALMAGAKSVTGCFFNGTVNDPQKVISSRSNIFNPPDPDFDRSFKPKASQYTSAGYSP
jgi:hypothetical protein